MTGQRIRFAGVSRFCSTSVGYVAAQFGLWVGAGGGAGGGTAMLPPSLEQNLTKFK